MRKFEEEITLHFTGQALDNHSMGVRILAPSLLAFADMLKDTQEIIAPHATTPAINIKATGAGSFIVELSSITTLIDDLISILNSDPTQALLSATGLGTIAIGAAHLVKKLAHHGTNPKREKLDGGIIRLTWNDTTTYTVHEQSIELASRITYRKNLQAFIEPITHDGIGKVEISGEKIEPLVISKANLPAFELDVDTEIVQGESVRRLTLQIMQLTLQGEYRWQFSDGGSTFSAIMADEAFKAMITGRTIRFAEGDQLEVELSEQQVKRADGALRIDRTITRVFRHLPAPEQTVILFNDENQ